VLVRGEGAERIYVLEEAHTLLLSSYLAPSPLAITTLSLPLGLYSDFAKGGNGAKENDSKKGWTSSDMLPFLRGGCYYSTTHPFPQQAYMLTYGQMIINGATLYSLPHGESPKNCFTKLHATNSPFLP
jgi:hypothetical protein